MEELTTLTVTSSERGMIAHALVVLAQMNDALDKHQEALEALNLWERVAPESVA